MAAARSRVSGAGERESGARTAVGAEPAQVGREKQKKSPGLPLSRVRRPQGFRSPPVSRLLASLREKMTKYLFEE